MGGGHNITKHKHNTTQHNNAKQSKAKLLLLLLLFKKKKEKKKVVSRSRRVLYSESFISLSLPTVSPFNHIFDKRHLTHSVPFRSISFSLSLSQQNSEPLCPPQPLWISEIDMWKLKLPLSYQLSLSQRYNYYLLVSLTFLFLVLYYIYNLTRVSYQIH